ncbi:hypothetical protein COCOBI_17-2550 [Coccomyxa sp. Obi]|nr:hypothetical protein COCOBI_17-2550 [Coccomyxa sp. Obi]
MVQVERLTVQFSHEREENTGRGGNSPVLAPLVGLIRQCSTSLRTLYLRAVPFEELFDSCNTQGDPETFQPLLGALCACTELRALYVSRKEENSYYKDSYSRLVLRLAKSLPNLRSLQWRCLKPNGAERPTPFSAAFLSAMATAPEPGLRLLQLDECNFHELISY